MVIKNSVLFFWWWFGVFVISCKRSANKIRNSDSQEENLEMYQEEQKKTDRAIRDRKCKFY